MRVYFYNTFLWGPLCVRRSGVSCLNRHRIESHLMNVPIVWYIGILYSWGIPMGYSWVLEEMGKMGSMGKAGQQFFRFVLASVQLGNYSHCVHFLFLFLFVFCFYFSAAALCYYSLLFIAFWCFPLAWLYKKINKKRLFV